MTFFLPWVLTGLLAVPLLVLGYRRVGASRDRRRAALAAQGLVVAEHRVGRRRHVPALLFLAAFALLVVAGARPQATVAQPHREGTVVLAFDTSTSMAATDIAPTRIAAAKAAARTFVAKEPETIKIGIVSFGDNGVITQKPTTNHAEVLAAIDRLAPQGGTSLGRGIQTSLSAIAGKTVELDAQSGSFEAQGQNLGFFGSAAVVMLSDGENTTGPDPVEVARMASTAGVKLYTVGLGSPGGTVLQLGGFQVATALDEPLLQDIAKTADGRYYAAADADALQQVYSSIDLAWVVEAKYTEISGLVAAAAALLLLIGAALSLTWFGRVM